MSNYKSFYYKCLGLNEDSDPSIGKEDENVKKGIKSESEHTQDDQLAKKIAENHLSDDPDYYSTIEKAGMPTDMEPMAPMISKLVSPTISKISHPSVIAVGVRGSRTGLLPGGGIVEDPEKARLGGFELIKNKKPNSQGAIANTPASDDIKKDGGHYTPDNKEITKGEAPTTAVKGDKIIHPFQTQQLGNKPFEDDGTTRDGEHTPEAAGGEEHSSGEDSDDKIEDADEVEISEPENQESSEEEKEEGEVNDGDDDNAGNVEIDIAEKKESLQERFKKLANIKSILPLKPLNEIGVPSIEDESLKSPTAKEQKMDKLVKSILQSKQLKAQTPQQAAEQIVIMAQKRGVKLEKDYDYILSKVTEYWK